MSIAPRSALLAAKLRSLVHAQWGDGDRAAVDFPGGAALVAGDEAWLLIDADPLKAFGPALVWSARNGAQRVHLLVDGSAAVLARRATCFRDAPTIWQVDDAMLSSVEPAPAVQWPAARPAPELAGLLVDADLEVVVEEGIVRAEVNGLEVARIVHGTTSTGIEIDAPLLEVGVGFADREMTAMLHGSLSPVDQLARVAEIVRQHRRPDAQRHPLNQMAPERWLRAALVRNPGRVGLRRLAPVAPATPRPNLKDTGVAMAEGETVEGARVVVACSVGVDLNLVPEAADVRLALDPSARLLLVVPERDAHPVTAELAARLHHPAEIIAIDDGWRDQPSQ